MAPAPHPRDTKHDLPCWKGQNLESLPHIQHAFFGRQGGVSTYPRDSLNTGLKTGDEFMSVWENRMRIACVFGLIPEHIKTVNQAHGPEVVVVDRTFTFTNGIYTFADALITEDDSIGLGIQYADCVPLLLADQKNPRIAAIHAGWRGAVSGVIPNTLNKLSKMGSKPEDLCVVLGPSIQQESYEVGQEVYDAVLKTGGNRAQPEAQEFSIRDSDDNPLARFFRLSKPGHHWFDLPGFVIHQLRQGGVIHIENLALDTYTNEKEFFSFRRSTHRWEKQSGQHMGVIRLRK